MNITTLLIDFDNTLMDTERLSLPNLIERFNTLYQSQIDNPLTLDVFQAEFHGLAGDTLCDALSAHYQITVDQKRLYENREVLMQTMYQKQPNGVKMAPNALETLTQCHNADLKLGLVTNNPLQRAFAAMRCAHNGAGAHLAQLFEANFFEANPIRKPEPDVYLRAMQQMKATAVTTLAIEDSPTGVKSARAAGITTWGYVGLCEEPQRLARDLKAQGCTLILEDWAELLTHGLFEQD